MRMFITDWGDSAGNTSDSRGQRFHMAPVIMDTQRITASEEFKKNPDLKEDDLHKLQQWVTTQKHLPEIPDEMLILLHHSCYYDLARTKDCIETYYTMRTKAPEFFRNRDATNPELVKSLEVLQIALLPVPDPEGNQILFQRLRDCTASNYMYADHLKLLYMTLDASFLRHGTTPGFVLVYDLEGFTMSHVARHGYTTIKTSSQYMQEGNPVRLKGIHVTNVYWWVSRAFAVVKPLLNKGIFDVMHFHKSNETLYKYVPKECLPKEAGGDLDSIEVYHAQNTKILESLRDFFEEDEKQAVDESKRENNRMTSKTE